MSISKRILVIDDERRMADSVCQLLQREGYEASAAYGGREGLAHLDNRAFDLVITDLRMADIDGIEVLRQIRKNHPETMTVVMTGHASAESAIEAIHHSAFDYVPKPFEIEQLLSTVSRAFQRIEADRLRSDMISMISHDIKVPMTSIIGYTSLIKDHRNGEWHPRADDFLNIIASNANRILALLDNYLTTCKFEAGRLALQREPVNMADVLADVESVITPEANKRNIEMTLDMQDNLPEIIGDENLLFRAICNIAINAIKYSPTNCSIDARIWVDSSDTSPLESGSLACQFENPGMGIPDDEIPHVFERYRRSKSGQGVAGSGIGLFVVKTIAEAHGGVVTVESEPNVTTRFTLHLPLATATTQT